jgi:hypothetical protein
VRNEIGVKILAMDAIMAECEARFGGRAKLLDHPILGPLSAPQLRSSSGAWTPSPETDSPASRTRDDANGLNAGRRGLSSSWAQLMCDLSGMGVS